MVLCCLKNMIKAFANAKLNLNLHLLPLKKEGLFPVHYINCELDLHDALWFEFQPETIEVVCDFPGVPENGENLVYKAAQLLKDYAQTPNGVKIRIEKQIPVRVGLGGGSSDAATALKVLVKMWNIKIDQKILIRLARQVGTDVCYSLIGGVALVEADGTKIKRLRVSRPELFVLILVPREEKPSTEWSFKQLSSDILGRHIAKADNLLNALKKKEVDLFFSSLHNDFEEPLNRHFPVINKMKGDLLEHGAGATNLCGAGLAMAGFYTDKKVAAFAQQRLKRKYKQTVMGRIL